MGIAVLTATDVAKSAAGIVLTEPGLGGIVAAVEEGRITFQRILTYTFRSILHKIVQVLFLFAGLVMFGTAVLTPPGSLLMASSVLDIGLFTTLAAMGIAMPPLPIAIIAGVGGAAVALALCLDAAKVLLLRFPLS